jgi:hypothetical protein
MIRHALDRGLAVPSDALAALDDGALPPERLVSLHHELTELVAPARPDGLRLIASEAPKNARSDRSASCGS